MRETSQTKEETRQTIEETSQTMAGLLKQQTGYSNKRESPWRDKHGVKDKQGVKDFTPEELECLMRGGGG